MTRAQAISAARRRVPTAYRSGSYPDLWAQPYPYDMTVDGSPLVCDYCPTHSEATEKRRNAIAYLAFLALDPPSGHTDAWYRITQAYGESISDKLKEAIR